MGASASKPGRKLASSIEKDVSSAVLAGRKGNVNTLPSQALKDKYAEHSIEKQLKETELEPEVDHLPLRSESFRNAPKFDASKLTKKLQKKSQAQDNLPEGKDGYDPQVNESYSNDFTKSVMKLGSQIQSHSINPNLDKGNAALRQIHNREELYKIGQQEAEDEKNGELKIRTVIHPRNLGGLLNDLSDPRVSRERILEDYQLDSNFLTELGDRFRLATQMAIIEEEAKDGEIMVQNTAPSSSGDSVTPPSNNGKMVKQEYDENGSLNEVDPERLKTLKNRLGMDDEVDELPRR